MNTSHIKVSWHSKIIADYSRKSVVSLILTLTILFVMAVVQLMHGEAFEWKNIAPLDTPDIWVRFLYSALTFVTIGALLYYVRFYQLLSMLFGSNRRGYRDTKKLIWTGLILLMFFVVIPAGVDAMNAIISFLYNILILLVYISPFGFVLVVGVATAIVVKDLKSRLKST